MVKVNNGGSSAIIVIIDAVAVVNSSNSGIKACFNLYCFSMTSLFGLNKDSHSTSLHAAHTLVLCMCK